ncbi:hypothetical protein ABPG74_004382 [Tetrahymena malaccensis]
MSDTGEVDFKLYYFYFYSIIIPYSLARLSILDSDFNILALTAFTQVALFTVDLIVELQLTANKDKNQNEKLNIITFGYHFNKKKESRKNDFHNKQNKSNNSLHIICQKNESHFKKTEDVQFNQQIRQWHKDLFQQEILNSLSTGIALISKNSQLIQSNRTLKSFFSKNNLDKLNLEESLFNFEFNQINNYNGNHLKNNTYIKNYNTGNFENKYFQAGDGFTQKQSQSYDCIPKIYKETLYLNKQTPQTNNSQHSKQYTRFLFNEANNSQKQLKQTSNCYTFQEMDYQQQEKQVFQNNSQTKLQQKNDTFNQQNSFEILNSKYNTVKTNKFEDISMFELNSQCKKSKFNNKKLLKWKKMHIQYDEDLQNLLNSPNFTIYQVINQLFKSQIDSYRILRSEYTISNRQKIHNQTKANQNSKSKFSSIGINTSQKNQKISQIVNNNTLILRGQTQSGETLFKISIYLYEGKEFKNNSKYQEDVLDDQENFNIDEKETFIMIELINIDNLIKQRDSNNIKSFKKKMLASLSHELRTPLNCSMQLIETLFHSGLLQDEDRDLFLAPAIQSNQLLLHIINDILDFCQINNGDLRLIFEEFEIRNAIYECISLFALQSSQKNLPIEIQIDSQLPIYIRSDQNRFKQVFLNILSNAVKFTEQGKIAVKVDYCQVLDISTENFVKISVQDTGCGIVPELAQSIFNGFNCNDLFQNNSNQSCIKHDQQNLSEKNFQETTFNQQNACQFHHGSSTKVGAGLGLSISQNLAKGLGSNKGIEFQSQPNIGSIFTFYVTDRKQQVAGCKLSIRSFHDIQFVNWQTIEQASSHKIQTSVILADKSKRISFSHKNSRFSQFQLENQSSQRKISIQYSHQSQLDKIKTLNQISKSSLMISERNIDINQDASHRKKGKFQEAKQEVQQLQSLRRWQQDLDKQIESSYREIPKIHQDQESKNSCTFEESNNLDSSYQDINQVNAIKTIKNIDIQTSGCYLLQNSQIFQQPKKQQHNILRPNESQNQNKLDNKKCFQMLSLMTNSETKKINSKQQILSPNSSPAKRYFEYDYQNVNEKYNCKHLIYSQNQIFMECCKSPEADTISEKINSKDKFNLKQDILNYSSQAKIQKIQQHEPNDEQQIQNKSNSQLSIELSQELSPLQNKSENSEMKRNLDRNNYSNNRCNTIYHETIQYKNNIDIIMQKIKDINKCSCPSILVVDDNDFNLYALEIRLKPYNIKVDKANNGLSALQKVQERYYSNKCCKKYQLIFMDIDMPIKNGYQSAQEINQFFNSINMKNLSPISACTAFVQQEEKERAFESGMQYYITKPVDSKKLEDVLFKVFKI